MSVNTFVLSGEVKRVDVNTKNTRKGPAAMILVQYGVARQHTDQAVQFLNVALIRVPPYVYEKCKKSLVVGAFVDIVGHTQGVLKPILSENHITNELVADRVQVVGDEDEVPASTASAETAAEVQPQ